MIKNISSLILLILILFLPVNHFTASGSPQNILGLKSYPEVLFLADGLVKGRVYKSGDRYHLTVEKVLLGNIKHNRTKLDKPYTYRVPINGERSKGKSVLNEETFLQELIQSEAEYFSLTVTENGSINLVDLVLRAKSPEDLSYPEVERDIKRILKLLKYEQPPKLLQAIHSMYIKPIIQENRGGVAKWTLCNLSSTPVMDPIDDIKGAGRNSDYDLIHTVYAGLLSPLRSDGFDHLSWMMTNKLLRTSVLLDIPLLLEEVRRPEETSHVKKTRELLAGAVQNSSWIPGIDANLEKSDVPVNYKKNIFENGERITKKIEFTKIEKVHFVKRWKEWYRKMLVKRFGENVPTGELEFLKKLRGMEGEVYRIAYRNYRDLLRNFAEKGYYPLDEWNGEGTDLWNRVVAGDRNRIRIPDENEDATTEEEDSDQAERTGRDEQKKATETGNGESEKEISGEARMGRQQPTPDDRTETETASDPVSQIDQTENADENTNPELGEKKSPSPEQKESPGGIPIWPFVLITILGGGTMGAGYVLSTRG